MAILRRVNGYFCVRTSVGTEIASIRNVGGAATATDKGGSAWLPGHEDWELIQWQFRRQPLIKEVKSEMSGNMTTFATQIESLTTAKTSYARIQVLVGAVMVQLILGTVYGYSVFWQPLEAELFPTAGMEAVPENAAAHEGATLVEGTGAASAATASRESESRSASLKYSFAICLLSFATAMVFAGRLQDLRGPRFTATLGGIILGIGFLIAGQMDHLVTYYICHALLMGSVVVAALLVYDTLFKELDRRRYPILQYVPHGIVTVAVVIGITLGTRFVSDGARDRMFMLWGTIGLLAGAGIGYAYVCPIAALVKWFPHHKGLVSGIAVAGFGLGAWVFSSNRAYGAVRFIEAHGIREFFTVHGLICIVVVIAGAMLLRNPPTVVQSTKAPNARSSSSATDSTWQELLRTGSFYVVWLMFFSGAMAGLMVIGILKPFAGSQLIAAVSNSGTAVSDALRSELLLSGAKVVGYLALFNAAGRVIWGLISDRIGRSATMTAMFLLQGVTLLTLSSLQTHWQLSVGAALVGFNFGGNFALFPSLTADMFGSKNIGANYGWVFTAYGAAGVMGIWAGNLAQRWTGSYFAAFAVAASLCFLSAALTVPLRMARAKAIAQTAT